VTSHSYSRSLFRIGFGVSAVRLGVFIFLVYREWSHEQTLALLPLVLLLYPEAFFVPGNFSWTLRTGIIFAGALLVGSFAIATVVIVAARVWSH
jgi:hypothetical protein